MWEMVAAGTSKCYILSVHSHGYAPWSPVLYVMWSSSLFAVSSIQWHDPHLADPLWELVAAGTSSWPLTTYNGVCERGIADWDFNSLNPIIMEATNLRIQGAWKMTATGGLMYYICSHSESVTVKVCTHKHKSFRDVFAPGPSARILDWTCYHRTPLCQIYILN